MAIKVIVELRAKPGRRAELMSLLERVAELGPSQRGFLGSRRYEVLDNPDMLIEIAEWESAGARVAHMEESAATGAYAPLLEMLATDERRSRWQWSRAQNSFHNEGGRRWRRVAKGRPA